MTTPVLTTPLAKNKKLNHNLEALRGFAALLVVIAHLKTFYRVFNGAYLPKLLVILAPNGHLCVLVFFVLSGFVIAESTKNKLTNQTAGLYLKKRFIRIYPVYFLALCLTLLISANHYSTSYILLNFLLLQILTVQPFIENGPAWSLNFEAVYYLLFVPFSFFRISPLLILIFSIIAGLCNYALYPHFNTPLVTAYFFGLAFWISGVFITRHSFKDTAPADCRVLLSALFIFLCMDRLLSKSGVLLLPDTISYFLFHKHLEFVDFIHLATYQDLAFLPYCIFLVLVFAGRKFKHQKVFFIILQLPFIYALLLTVYGVIMHKPDANMGSFLINVCYYLLSLVLPLLNIKFLSQIGKKVIDFGAWTGGISYAIYIIHCPLIFALGRLTSFTGTPLSFAVRLIVFFAVLISLSFLLERKFQPYVKKIAGL